MTAPHSKCREMYDDGSACSCHINPPCSFCTAMDEEEADAYWSDGIEGLETLWDQRDESAEADR
jgi:hypothetical protein